jgi:hypothetical protein
MDPFEPESNLEWITKHHLAGYGWQHAIGLMQEERALHAVAKQTKQYARSVGREVVTFVYRDAQCADKEYRLAATILNDSSKDGWFLSQNGTVCTRHGQWPDSRQLNFSVPAVRDWYVDTVVGEVAAEEDVDVIFFDETDWVRCWLSVDLSVALSLSVLCWLARCSPEADGQSLACADLSPLSVAHVHQLSALRAVRRRGGVGGVPRGQGGAALSRRAQTQRSWQGGAPWLTQ